MSFKVGDKVSIMRVGVMAGKRSTGYIADSNSMSSIVKLDSGEVFAMHNSEIKLIEEENK